MKRKGPDDNPDATRGTVSTRDAAASDRRCTVTGHQHANGAPMSVVCEQIDRDGLVVLYPHGVSGHGVVLDARQQRALAHWLLDRQTTRPTR